jgi:Yip1-like protein
VTQITAAAAPERQQGKSLGARILGIVFSPGETHADIAARPRALGALVFVILMIGVTSFAFLSTEVGQNAMINQQVRFMESFGRQIPDQVYAQMEASAGRARYFGALGVLVTVPVMTALIAGLILAIFNAVMGGDASFKQAFAIVAHSQIISALGQVFVTPLNYRNESMSSAANLAVFLPMLDETGFMARFLGMIDLFRVWWVVSLAIGIAVLYKRKTAPIAWALLGTYVVIALAIAGVMAALG